MSDTQAEPRRTRLSAVWLIPLAAALIGLWLVFSYLSSQGPVITLKLTDAEGINAGKFFKKHIYFWFWRAYSRCAVTT